MQRGQNPRDLRFIAQRSISLRGNKTDRSLWRKQSRLPELTFGVPT
jgi:hypothetical protein